MAQKSARKSEVVAFVTPWVQARFPKISTPDTEGKFADGKFKTDALFLADADHQKARAAAEAAAAKLFPGVSLDEINMPLKEFFDKPREGEGEDKVSAGWGLVLKSKYRPAVFDARKNKLPEGVRVGGGSIIRIASAFFPWEKPTEETIVENGKRRKVKTVQKGISLRLGDVQVKELSQGGGKSGDGSAFDEVEGFEYTNEAGEAPFDTADDAADF
jgi:hypothetical protein